MRLADGDTVRLSTNEWSETGIRVSHSIQVIIRFTALLVEWNSDKCGKGKRRIGNWMRDLISIRKR